MFNKLSKLITLETGYERVTPETTLEDLGIDSLEFLALIRAVEEGFGVEIPTDDLVKLQTVNDIAAYLA